MPESRPARCPACQALWTWDYAELLDEAMRPKCGPCAEAFEYAQGIQRERAGAFYRKTS